MIQAKDRPGGRYRPLLVLTQWSSAAAGAVIAWRGLRRRDGLGALATFGGAALAATGAASALAGPELIRRSGQSLLRMMPQGSAEARSAVTINRPPAELYAFWRDLANLAQLMPDILEIRPQGEGRWRWAVRGPGGASLEWEAELVEERENELIAWRSVGDWDIASEGAVRFRSAPGGRGSEVHVTMSFGAPAGRPFDRLRGRAVAWLFGAEPGRQLRDGLRRLKTQMETGEAAVLAPRPAGGAEREDAIA